MSLGTDSVVTREVAYLNDVGNGLPVLSRANSQDPHAPFDLIAAYWPRSPGNLRAVYATRSQVLLVPWSSGRVMSRHAMKLKVWWPVINGDGQTAQADLDGALDALLVRVEGPMLNKTHGGRFLSAAEGTEGVRVSFTDPERALDTGRALQAEVTYVIDDAELNL